MKRYVEFIGEAKSIFDQHIKNTENAYVEFSKNPSDINKKKFQRSYSLIWKQLYNAIVNYRINKLKEIIHKFGVNNINIDDSICEVGSTALIVASMMSQKNDMVKFILDQPGIEVNTQTGRSINFALNQAAMGGNIESLKLLLKHPDIDTSLKDSKNTNFIDNYISWNNILKNDNNSLIDYDLQNTIIKNNPNNIFVFIRSDIDLIHPKIREEHPDLFKAKTWGLI